MPVEKKRPPRVKPTEEQAAAATIRIPYCPHDPSLNQKQELALIAWRFLPGAFEKPVEVGYGGAAGGGKSDWLLMAALEYVDVPGYHAILFRRTFTELRLPGALMARAREWLASAPGLKWRDDEKEWVFPSGATLGFGYIDNDADVTRYQGGNWQFVGFDECTHFTEYQYLYLHSRIRRLEGQEVPLRMYSATNPGGVGHSWYKARFVTPVKREPRRLFVPARLDDNPAIDRAAYVESLSHLSPGVREQLLNGDWDAFEGRAYEEMSESSVVAPFEVPVEWQRLEGMDHGVNHPTAWLAAACDYDGNLVVFDEYHQPGLVSDHANEILRRREAWWLPEGQVATVFGDPSIRNRFGTRDVTGRELSVETEYSDRGVGIVPGQNDRREGYARVLELVRPDGERRFPDWHPRAGQLGSPRLFVFSRCVALLEQLRTAPVKPQGKDSLDMVDPQWESERGHAHAALRYMAMGRFGPSKRGAKELSWEDFDPEVERRLAVQRMEARRPSEVGEGLWI